ncbi:unnamed protein product [Ixodes persulcatus]
MSAMNLSRILRGRSWLLRSPCKIKSNEVLGHHRWKHSTSPACIGDLRLHGALQELAHQTRLCGSGMVRRTFSTEEAANESSMSEVEYEAITKETLESLAERFDEILEDVQDIPEADLALSDGVLTLHLGPRIGTFVINKQTPNRQIWLSSPVSGPKRYDFVDDKWIYKRDGVPLHRLLAEEVSALLKKQVGFSGCSYGA